jgi:hypothetical protein
MLRRLLLGTMILALAGCSATSSPSPGASAAVGTPTASASNRASAGAVSDCDVGPGDWAAVPADRPCLLAGFEPPMSITVGSGWLGVSQPDRWSLTRDNGYYTEIHAVRYGGAVVPQYCVDPPKTIPTATADQVVAWLKTISGLDMQAAPLTVGGYPVWQLDLVARAVEHCSPDPAKGALLPLWSIEGQPVELPETMDEGTARRVYLISSPSAIVVITVSTPAPADDPAGIKLDQFLGQAEEVIAGITFL